MPMSFPNRYGAVFRASVGQQPLSHGFGAGIGGSTPMPWTHGHGDLELNFVYRGSPRYVFDNRELSLPAGSLCAFWAAIPHRVISLERGTSFTWLNVPLTALLRWNLDAAFMSRLFSGEVIVDASGAWDADLMRRWLRDLSSYETDVVRTVEIEVQARIRRLSRLGVSHVDEEEHTGSQLVGAMTAFLVASYREPISASDVAEAAGLNRHYAMRLFKKCSGISIWQYLLRLRVSHAQQLLLTTDAPVVTVGLESGFASPSRFYDIFTRECKLSPAEYRKRAAGERALTGVSA